MELEALAFRRQPFKLARNLSFNSSILYSLVSIAPLQAQKVYTSNKDKITIQATINRSFLAT